MEKEKVQCEICKKEMRTDWNHGLCIDCDYDLGEGLTKEDILKKVSQKSQ